jgi:predicted CXXCH cytochrome family protein
MNRYINRLGVLTLAIVVAGAMGYAAIDTTVHDLSITGGGVAKAVAADPNDADSGQDEICIFCHVPHNSTEDPLLWNHQRSSASYTVYQNNTLNSSPTDFAGSTTDNVSALCLSCHDGTIAINNTTAMNDPTISSSDITRVTAAGLIVGTRKLSNDLTNDHPINFTYDAALATADGGLVTPDDPNNFVDAAKKVSLFGGKMQCGSCHDPHDIGSGNFLVVDNSGSDLCQTCHTK